MSEHSYKVYPYPFNSKGLSARFSIDRTPEEMYWNLLNFEVRQENALSSRLGRTPITQVGGGPAPLADLNVHTLSRLKGTGLNTWRYGGANQNIYRRTGDTFGAYGVVSGINQLSGNRFSSVTYRPTFSSFPYVFFADSSAMLKDNGTFNPLELWGIFPPLFPANAVVEGNVFNFIDDFGSDINPLFFGISGSSGYYNLSSNFAPVLSGSVTTCTVVGSAGIQIATVVTSAAHGINAAARSGQVNLGGLSIPSFNGPWRISSVINPTTFVCTRVGAVSGSATGGTFTVFSTYFRVNTSSGTAIPSGFQTVTPASMANIEAGMLLLVDAGAAVPVANIIARPTTLLNGWGTNGHIGDYELGVSQGHNFPSLNGPALPYSNPQFAYDGDNTTFAVAMFQHTHQYAGCVWSFGATGATSNPLTLNILSSVPQGVTQRSAGIWYSLDGGSTWTNIYNTAARPQQWDTIALPPSQDTSKVQVLAFLDSHDDMTQYVNEINISQITAQINTGNPEYVVVISTTATTFTGFFAGSHATGATIQDASFSGALTGSVTADLVGVGPLNLDSFTVAGVPVPASDIDIITFFMNLSAVANVSSVTLEFDVGNQSFTDFYSFQPSLTGATNGTWAQYQTARGNFVENGAAGLPGHTWANVSAYRFTVVTLGTVTFQVDNLYMTAPGGPNVGPGSLYDYRYTYFNNQTGDESNPSVPMVSTAYVDPVNEAVLVTVTPSTDPQVTNINIYRRGGALTTGWTFVDQISASSTQYIDTFSDAEIASNSVLALDNDPPLTTTLPVPVNTFLGSTVIAGSVAETTPLSMANIFVNQILTIDSGNNQETVTVISVTATTFTAYYQLSHGSGAIVTASTRQGHAVNLAAIGFDQAWLAGDPDNPNRLYYSKITNVEAFPPENWIEIGTPADPIMAVIFKSGQLFVKTQALIFRVLIPYPGAIPTPYPTGSRNGLYASFAFCIGEGFIPYLSKDGIYIFQGENSSYSSEPIEWLFADKEPNLGPVPEQDPTQSQNTIMAYYKNEVFVSYKDKTGVQRRIILDLTKGRYRNDDVPATAMFYEEDTKALIIGQNNGMIYQDRVGDVDVDLTSPTTLGNVPINLSLQTGAKDQGNPLNNKIFNELTLDFDSAGQNLAVALLANGGVTLNGLGNFASTGRGRVPIRVMGGQGLLSQNVVLTVTGAVVQVIHLYDWYIKAALDTEFRTTFDSFWTKQGTDHFKIWKQCWLEYIAPDPAGITFNVFIEGNLSTPQYSFTVPQALVRTTKRVRFPAVKATLWRLVGASPSQFQLYGESFVEYKDITVNSGYQKEAMGAISAQGSV